MKEAQEKLIICSAFEGLNCKLDGYKCLIMTGHRCNPREKRKEIAARK